jgi:hypothetical protein
MQLLAVFALQIAWFILFVSDSNGSYLAGLILLYLHTVNPHILDGTVDVSTYSKVCFMPCLRERKATMHGLFLMQ